MFLLYSLSLGGPIWVGGPRVFPVRAHSSYATAYTWNGTLRHWLSQPSIFLVYSIFITPIYMHPKVPNFGQIVF
jgi:hypothetical protein